MSETGCGQSLAWILGIVVVIMIIYLGCQQLNHPATESSQPTMARSGRKARTHDGEAHKDSHKDTDFMTHVAEKPAAAAHQGAHHTGAHHPGAHNTEARHAEFHTVDKEKAKRAYNIKAHGTVELDSSGVAPARQVGVNVDGALRCHTKTKRPLNQCSVGFLDSSYRQLIFMKEGVDFEKAAQVCY